MDLTLKPGQMDAVHQLSNGKILCAEVGLGKSLTALGYYYLRNGGDEKFLTGGQWQPFDNRRNLYIITTAKKRDNCEWDSELAYFLLDHESDGVTVDSWNNVAKYKDVRNSFFIFDEQRAVGSGPWADSLIKIARNGNEWIMLSATPGDRWCDYIPVFVANGFYKNKTEFERNHVIWKPYVKYKAIDGYYNTRRLVRLRDSLLVDIPDERVIETHEIYVEVDYKKDLYKRVYKERWDPFKNEPLRDISSLIFLLRRIVNTDESRQVKLLELLEKHPTCIIFYNFDYELEILRCLLDASGWPYSEWNGHKHQEIVEGNKWAYLVNYTAGCDGWNCIRTDTIIFYSLNYSYRTMHQAEGRINRLNTPFEELYYYIFKSHAHIDLAIDRAIRTKQKFNEGKFGKEIGW